jgi:hypothetical protein
MGNRVGARYYRIYVRSCNVVDVVGEGLWAPTASFNWDTILLLESMRLSVHATRFHDTGQMESLPRYIAPTPS